LYSTISLKYHWETFARAGILFSGKAKTHGMRKFILINDRLSRACPASIASALGTFLTPSESKRTIVQRSHWKSLVKTNKKNVEIKCTVTNHDGKVVVKSVPDVIAPTEQQKIERPSLPEISLG